MWDNLCRCGRVLALQHYNSMCGDPLQASYKSQFFGSGCFYIYLRILAATHSGNGLHHGGDVWSEARLLGDDGSIQIADCIVVLLCKSDYRAQQFGAGNPGILRIGIREVASQITKPESTENSIADRMQEYVSVGVS